MSIWNRVQTLNHADIHKIHNLYGDHFPIEVRGVLAPWIEESVRNPAIDPDNPSHELLIRQFLDDLHKQIEFKVKTMANDDPYLLRIKLLGALPKIQEKFGHDPASLFRCLRECLAVEINCVEQHSFRDLQLQHDHVTAEIIPKLTNIRARVLETADILQQLEQEQENFAIKCHEFQKLEGIIRAYRLHNATIPANQVEMFEQNASQQKDRLESLNQKMQSLAQMRSEFIEKISTIATDLSATQSNVLDELAKWKRENQLARNSAQLQNSLDTLQSFCEDLAELIWSTRNQLKEIERLQQSNSVWDRIHPCDADLATLNHQVTQLFSRLLSSTFIVEKQPPQVMKKGTRFVSAVRLLVGGRLNMTPPEVKVTIINEVQAIRLLKNEQPERANETSGEILNNSGTMQYNSQTRYLSAFFRNMQLKRIQRAEKKGSEVVTDAKFYLLFQCVCAVGELKFKLWTLSVPVVVIVHGVQDPHAWAPVFWANSFGDPGLSVPMEVPWSQFAHALNAKFEAITGRGLTEDHIHFLAAKLSRTPESEQVLSWTQFCKVPLRDKAFTFWDWFYAIMKLTKQHLSHSWVDGSIMGFVDKQKAMELLSSCAPGTFLLRFSDSELGGITISWVHTDQNILSLAPFSGKELAMRSLADRIFDLPHLHCLYPNISKSSAFGKYYTSTDETLTPNSNGYVRRGLRTTILGVSDVPYSQPGTPIYPASPDNNTFGPYVEQNFTSESDSLDLMDFISMYDNSDDGGNSPDFDLDIYMPNGLIFQNFGA